MGSTTSKIPSKSSLRKFEPNERSTNNRIKKENEDHNDSLLDDTESKLPLTKKEILARARAKSRAWAESKLSPTPVKSKSSPIVRTPEVSREHEEYDEDDDDEEEEEEK